MNTKALRQKILNLAIHGKLVPQDPNDEPASVLLERIRDEKERLIKEGKIKRPKKTKTTSDKPHYPYLLPEGWVWCKLEDIASIGTGATPLTKCKEYYLNGNIPWVNSSSTKDSVIETPSNYITSRAIQDTNCVVYPKGTLIVAMYGEGKTRGQVSELRIEAATNQACAAICPFEKEFKNYLKLFFESNYLHLRALAEGGTQPNLNLGKISNYEIPLPPLEEQCRIFTEIKHWISLIDVIENGKWNINETIKQAKSKILNLAIHGKLVPQDPTDEPASELLKRINPKAEITSDNGHYQKLPEGWCECCFDDIFNIKMGQSPNGSSINHQQGVEFHQGKILFGDKYLKQSDMFTDAPTKLATPNSLLLCVRAPVGVVNITQREICIGRGLCSLKPNAAINLDYAYHALTTYQSDFESKSTGSTFKAISGSIIRNEVFALPPLQEQYRIVTKIEDIFAQLDAIEASL